jgi:hypothetical protein
MSSNLPVRQAGVLDKVCEALIDCPAQRRRRIAPLLLDLAVMLRDAGNANSGNHGHKGRPGEVGGSGAGGASPEEKQKKIDSVKIDFDRDNILPELNKEDLEELGKASKPVLLKKDIIEKNRYSHPDVKESDYAQIIGQSLYNPDLVVPGHKEKPYFNFLSRMGDDKNTIVLLELSDQKNNFEIVNLHWINDKGRVEKEKKGEKIPK